MLKLTAQKMLADLSVKVSGANYILSWDNKTSGPHRVGSFPSQIFDDLGLPRDDPAIIQVLSEKISEAERGLDITLDELADLFPIIGERENVKAFILAIMSTRLPPEWRIKCLFLEGANSAGKNYTAHTILSSLYGHPDFIELSAMSEGYFRRALPDDVDHKIIYIQESIGLPDGFHTLISEGRFRYQVLERNGNGAYEPIDKETVGYPLLITTNNYFQKLGIDLQHRALRLVLDDSAEQTRRILEHQARLAADPQYAAQVNERLEAAKQILRNKLSSIPTDQRVRVPYAADLINEMRMTPKARRDYPKLLSLIMASALFYQSKRERVGDAIMAGPEDLEEVRKLGVVFMGVASDLSPRERQILEACKSLKESGETITRQKILRMTRLPYSSVTYCLTQLVTKDLLLEDRSGREIVYDLP
jgi:hypothetical protein